MYKEYQMVRDFHLAFGHPVVNVPTLMSIDRAGTRYNWMQEELDEFLQADSIDGQVDALIDELYFVLGTLVEIGVQPDTIFEIVHQANMSKLFSDGKPHYNADGKVIKPEGWEAPEPKIQAEIKRMMEEENV